MLNKPLLSLKIIPLLMAASLFGEARAQGSRFDEEELVSRQVDKTYTGIGRSVRVFDLLVERPMGRAKNLFLIAKSMRGLGTIDVTTNDGRRTLQVLTLSDDLSSQQVSLRGLDRQDVNSLSLRMNGFIQLALVGISSERQGGGGPGNPNPTPPPTHPIPAGPYEFRGKFADQSVYFSGYNRDELNRSCLDYMKRSSLNLVNTAVVNDVKFTTSFFMNSNTLCALATFNSRQAHGRQTDVLLDAKISGLPVKVEIGRGWNPRRDRPEKELAEVLDLIDRYTEALISSHSLNNRFSVEETNYTTSYFVSNKDLAKKFLKYNTAVQTGYVKAQGTVQGMPFRFSGYSATDINSQCVDYMTSLKATYSLINDITVNGKRSISSRFLGVDDICMMIVSESRP